MIKIKYNVNVEIDAEKNTCFAINKAIKKDLIEKLESVPIRIINTDTKKKLDMKLYNVHMYTQNISTANVGKLINKRYVPRFGSDALRILSSLVLIENEQQDTFFEKRYNKKRAYYDVDSSIMIKDIKDAKTFLSTGVLKYIGNNLSKNGYIRINKSVDTKSGNTWYYLVENMEITNVGIIHVYNTLRRKMRFVNSDVLTGIIKSAKKLIEKNKLKKEMIK